MTSLNTLSAADAARGIAKGEFSSEELVSDCLERINEVEDTVGAWAFIDPDLALEQAKAADKMRYEGATLGPLHGVPVGIKDIFNTSDMPTESGTPLHENRHPDKDATPVARLRQAGAVIMGKTVTAELAVLHPGKTANPHDPARTPGGSSSGSAAAVAAHMVPLAIGTQTNGSVIRPASYCGVVGFKPSFGLISRAGVNQVSKTLDQIGTFGRTIEDAALCAEVMMGYDVADDDTHPVAHPRLVEVSNQEPLVPPQYAFVKSPVWDQADADVQGGLGELAEHLGEQCKEVTLAPVYDEAVDWHRYIMHTELANSFEELYENGRDQLSDLLAGLIEAGREVRAVDYHRGLQRIAAFRNGLEETLQEYDAILTPAATGEAPVGLDATGNPIFCTLWTYLGLPCVSLPLLQGSNEMPIGVQLVGRKGEDDRLLRTARALMDDMQRD